MKQQSTKTTLKTFIMALVAMALMTTPVLAEDVGTLAHTSSADVTPTYVNAGQSTSFSVQITNDGNSDDSIKEVRIYNLSDYTGYDDFESDTKSDWNRDVGINNGSYDLFTAQSTGDEIAPGDSDTFTFSGTSPNDVNDDTCQEAFEFDTRDSTNTSEGEWREIEDNVFVDDKAPNTDFEFLSAYYATDDGENFDYYVDSATEIRFNASDNAASEACESGVDTIIGELFVDDDSTVSGEFRSIEQQLFEPNEDGEITISTSDLETDEFQFQEGFEYKVEFYSNDSVGNEESVNTFTFEYDGTEPTVNSEITGTPYESIDEEDYITTNTTVTLSCSDVAGDTNSGPATLYWNWTRDDGTNTFESGPFSEDGDEANFTFEEASQHTLEYWCEDNVAKQSKTKSRVINVDEEGPALTRGVNDDEWNISPTLNGSPLVSFDGGYFFLTNVVDQKPIHASGVDSCNISVRDSERNLDLDLYGDGGIFYNVNTTRFEFDFQRNSYHNVTVECSDNLGNTNAFTTEVYVDGKAPYLSTDWGENAFNNGTTQFVGNNTNITVNATDEKVGVENVSWGVEFLGNDTTCSDEEPVNFDSGNLTDSADSSSDTFQFGDNIHNDMEGTYVLHSQATDSYGQTNETAECFELDLEDPVNETGDDGDTFRTNLTRYVTQNTSINLSCTDEDNFQSGVANLEVQWDWLTNGSESQAETTERYCEELTGETGNVNNDDYCEFDGDNVVFNFLEDTKHHVDWKCTDNVGNVQIANHTYFVDTVPPTTESIIFGPQYEDEEGNMYLDGVSGFNLNVTSWGPHLNEGDTYYQFRSAPDQQCDLETLEGIWNGWYVNGFTTDNESVGDGESSTDNRGDFEFATRAGEDVLSLQVNDSGVASRTYQYRSMKLSEIDELMYTTYNANDIQTATLQLEWARNWSDNNSYQGNLIYSPSRPENVDVDGDNPTTGEFQTWNTTAGYWYTSEENPQKNPVWSGTWADLQTEFPDAEIRRDFGRVGVKLGTAPNSAFESSVANVTVNDNTVQFSGDQFVPGEGFQEMVGPVTEYEGEGIPTGEESCHVLEYFSEDRLNNSETPNQEYYYVDTSVPANVKEVGEPSLGAETPAEQPICFNTTTETDGDNVRRTNGEDESPQEVCYGNYDLVTSETEITLSCEDVQPHPSGADKLYYELKWAENETDNLSTHEDALTLCKEHDGTYTDGVCEVDVEDGEELTMTLPEESYHEVNFWCEDNVEKTSEPRNQLYAVDNTGPITTKHVNEPSTEWNGTGAEWYDGTVSEQDGEVIRNGTPNASEFCDEEGACYNVTTITPLSLTCDDPQPHPSGEQGIHFRVELDGFQTGEMNPENVTQTYCDEYNGTYNNETGYCELNRTLDGVENEAFYFLEESEHKLEYKCEDNLGNVGDLNEQIYKVRTGEGINVTLNQKWNLISTPFALFEDSPEDVFEEQVEDGTLRSVWTYEDGEWKGFNPEVPSNANELEEIEPGYGYWVQMEEDSSLFLAGSNFDTTAVPPQRELENGWNLVGPYGLGDDIHADELESPFQTLDNVQPDVPTYNGPGSQYGKVGECALYTAKSNMNDIAAGSVRGYWEPRNLEEGSPWIEVDSWGEQYFESGGEAPVEENVLYSGAGYWINTEQGGASYAPPTSCQHNFNAGGYPQFLGD